jgi:N-acetyl-gamma-glutamyl-phosphate reductase
VKETARRKPKREREKRKSRRMKRSRVSSSAPEREKRERNRDRKALLKESKKEADDDGAKKKERKQKKQREQREQKTAKSSPYGFSLFSPPVIKKTMRQFCFTTTTSSTTTSSSSSSSFSCSKTKKTPSGASAAAAVAARAWISSRSFAPTTASRQSNGRRRTNSGAGVVVFNASSSQKQKKRVFIDGEAGTTGLQVRDRLEKRSEDIELIQLPDALRKDAKAREEALNEADCAILCLPDAAAVEAVALVTNPNTVIIDASTAYRTNDEWTYGFPELSKEQREKVKTAKRISNPGCYPTGFIGLTKPLVDSGFIPKGLRTTVNAVSGYTGGGKQLIAIYESPEAEPYGAYGFNLNHKHIPEMRKYSGLEHEPIFQPAVGSFAQGMLVSVPLFYDNMANVKSGKQLQECLKDWYKDSAFVSVREYNQMDDLERGAFLRADGLRDTNKLELSVFANDEKGTCLLIARLDNLGKGASGAAVQNLNLSLGLDESVGL